MECDEVGIRSVAVFRPDLREEKSAFSRVGFCILLVKEKGNPPVSAVADLKTGTTARPPNSEVPQPVMRGRGVKLLILILLLTPWLSCYSSSYSHVAQSSSVTSNGRGIPVFITSEKMDKN